MALDPKVKKLLNDFSKSQPALQLTGEPAATAGIQLGDLLEEGINPDLTQLEQDVIDAQADATQALQDASTAQGDATQALQDAADALAAAEDAESQVYSAAGAVGVVWDTATPATIKEALDRIAAALAVEMAAPIP